MSNTLAYLSGKMSDYENDVKPGEKLLSLLVGVEPLFCVRGVAFAENQSVSFGGNR